MVVIAGVRLAAIVWPLSLPVYEVPHPHPRRRSTDL
jgi:hypothetical protein